MADPLFCPWLINAPCLKSEIWAAWAQALLSGVGIIAAAWLPSRAARTQRKDRFYAVTALMMETVERMHLVADCIALRRLQIGVGRHDEELTHLTAALDAIPAHELPEGGLLFSIKGVRRQAAAMNELHRRVTSFTGYTDVAWEGFRQEARELLQGMEPHIDQAMALGEFRYGSWLYRARHRLNNRKKRRAAAGTR